LEEGVTTEIVISPTPGPGEIIPNGMSINPWLDWAPILGIPFWVYITGIFILVFLFANLYWLLRIGRLGGVKGYVESLRAMKQEDALVWIISRVQKLTFECMTIKDNVLSSLDPMNISMWYVSSPMGIITVAGKKSVVISEDFDRNRDFITEIALTHNLDAFNNALEYHREEVEKRFKQKLLAAGDDEDAIKDLKANKPRVMKLVESFDDFDKYGKQCLQNLSKESLKIPPYNIFNPNAFRKYFPIGNSSMHFGGDIIMESRDMNIDKKEKGFWEVHAILILCAGIGLIAIMAAWLFPVG
jgi:hypothetical protein